MARPRCAVWTRGRVVCPGFIDVHSHSDLTLLSAPRGRSQIQQGVTTEVNGNCGLAVAPVENAASMRHVRRVLCRPNSEGVDLDPGATRLATISQPMMSPVVM
ncbi:MAG: amidohydrolase family protein [Chloroflexi bacterium]|nr:amidohydrolase family protein [Chloroflexota bacterium]